MGEEVEAFDLQRMFLGDISYWFLLEVVFRTAFMFVYTLVLVRTTGKRGMGELSPFELLLVVALGSAVGDPMFYADVPLVHAMVVVATIVFLQRSVGLLIDHSKRAERVFESSSSRLVLDGVMDTEAMRAERFSREELFMLLREEGVEQLGQVKRAYLEPSGRISAWLFSRESVSPGLPVYPADDPDCPLTISVGAAADIAGPVACVSCGATEVVAVGDILGSCATCQDIAGWVPASTSPGDGNGPEPARRSRKRGPFGR